ncbi:MAG: response regulator [Pseudomonadota bacterium]
MTKRVLVIEDEPNITSSLSFLLQRSGFDVQTEDDGKAGLAAVLADPPDILILDVMLPGMDGYQILERLRGEAKTRDLPILMLTAKGQQEDRQSALDRGADLFITKPFANAEILEAVQQLSAGRPA